MTSAKPIEYGDYFLTRKIATGGMAELFRARKVGEAGFEKLLVIKRLLPHLSEDQEIRTMFLDEARLASGLTHINIAQVYDLGKAQTSDPSRPQQETTYFIAMEYVFGKSLAETIRRGQAQNNPLTTENALKVALSAAQGLEYAHAKKDVQGRHLGLVHRDISPQNILISYEGEVKLVDFGIAKALNQSTTTRPGMLKGKFSYMAPEQAKGEDVDQRTDVYALGVVLWEALTGRQLFTGDSEAAILGKVIDPKVEPPSSLVKDIPAELDAICLKCLEAAPEDRYANAQDLCGAIEQYLQGLNTFPSSYSLRGYMHSLFEAELDTETGQIQVEMETVLTHESGADGPGPETAPAPDSGPGDETKLYQAPALPGDAPKGGKGKLLALVGAAVLVLAGIVVFVMGGGEEPQKASKDTPPPNAQTAQASAADDDQAAQTQAPAKSPDSATAGEPPAQARKPEPAKPVEPKVPPEVISAREDIQAGRFDQALAKLEQVAGSDAKSAQLVAHDRARALVGRAGLEGAEAPDKALADLDQAAQLDPKWAEVHYQTGRILTRLKKFDQALEAYSRAITLDPTLDGAFFNQGYIHLQQGSFKPAIESFEKVVQLESPFKADAYVNMAVCFVRLDQKDQAMKMLRLALAANPNHKLAQRYLKKLTAGPKGK